MGIAPGPLNDAQPDTDDADNLIGANCFHCGEAIVKVILKSGQEPVWLHSGCPTRAGQAPVRYRHCMPTNTIRPDGAVAEPEPVPAVDAEVNSPDPVRPNYYAANIDGYPVQAIDVIEALGLTFHLGNAIKYMWRAGRKPGATALTDLRKARYYLDRHIRNLEADAQEGH